MIRRNRDNFRRDNIEAREFIYPDDSARISRKEAGEAAAYTAASTSEALMRAGIPLPLRALIRGGKDAIDKVFAVANRKPPTQSMHKGFLNDKYGETGWDVYKDRVGGEQRNEDAFFFNKQDLGNGNTFTQREAKRFAGEALSDDWMEDIRLHGLEQDMLEEAVEQNRQLGIVNAIHGEKEAAAFMDPNNRSRTTEQQLYDDLVLRGEMPDIIPPDRIYGRDVSDSIKEAQPGFAGQFQDGSEIRRDVSGSLSPNGTLNLNRGEVRTEIPSPGELDDIYDGWVERREGGWEARANQTNRSDFNNLAAEYYGQQGLKLRDGIDPSAQMIDSQGMRGVANSEQGDFSFTDRNGNARVIDNQQRERKSGMGDSLSMNLLRQSALRPGDEKELISLMDIHSRRLGTNNVDTILRSVFDEKGLEITSDFKTAVKGGVRPGKHLGNSSIGEEAYANVPRNQIQGVLYNIVDDFSDDYGMLPKDLVQVDNDQVMKYLGNLVNTGKLNDANFRISNTGGLSIEAPNTFKGLASTNPSQMAQLSEPFAINQPKPAKPKLKPRVKPANSVVTKQTASAPQMTPQERYELRQIELQRRHGGPRVDPNFDPQSNRVAPQQMFVSFGEQMSPQERFERKQMELQRRHGGPRIDPNFVAGHGIKETTTPKSELYPLGYKDLWK